MTTISSSLESPGQSKVHHNGLLGSVFTFDQKNILRLNVLNDPAFSADVVPAAIEAAELTLIVETIDPTGARRRSRWAPARAA